VLGLVAASLVQPLTGYVAAKPDKKFMVDMKFFLIMQKIMPELVADGEILAAGMMMGVHADSTR
jgi:hypothetical protein